LTVIARLLNVTALFARPGQIGQIPLPEVAVVLVSTSDGRANRVRRALLPLAAATAVAFAVLAPGGATAGSAAAPSAADVTPMEIRVVAPSAAQLTRLQTAYDLLEVRRGKDFMVMGDQATLAALQAEGFRVKVEKRYAPLPTTRSIARDGVTAAAYATFYGGYHTVAAHRQHLTDVAAAYPTLAKVVDYGDSWLKRQGRGGNDLLAMCITQNVAGNCALSPTAPRPRSVVYAAIHARELATAEIAWNWIDYLTTSYGSVSAVTNLLNSTEVWVIPVANPDGRQIVESGGNSPYYQRKNANDSRGSCRRPPTSSNQHGVDMNRNATWHWGGVGSSTSACTQTYRGTTAASEPETAAQQALFNSLFRDRRGTGSGDAAPADTTGTFMSYHSYAGLILYPWGDTTTDAPNGAKLRALADRMNNANGYQIGQGPEILYGTTGTTDDDLYGRLGVASFTTELGASGTSCDGFMPAYSCVGSRYWPQERQALLTLAQAAAGPYR
jgi:carboxypeptidase T